MKIKKIILIINQYKTKWKKNSLNFQIKLILKTFNKKNKISN
jgi:hypothetical protein